MTSKIFRYFKKYHRQIYRKLMQLFGETSDSNQDDSAKPQTYEHPLVTALKEYSQKRLEQQVNSFFNQYPPNLHLPAELINRVVRRDLSGDSTCELVVHSQNMVTPPVRQAIGEALTAAVPLPDLMTVLAQTYQSVPVGGKPGKLPSQLSELVLIRKVLQERKSLLGALTEWITTLNNRELAVIPTNDFGQTEVWFDENAAADEALVIELMATVKQHIAALEQANRLLTNKARPDTAKKLKALTGIEITTEETERQTMAQKLQVLKELFNVINDKPFDQMTYIITYDITDNKVRQKVANFLLQMGMRRIQKSVFMGSLPRPTYNRIFETIRAIQSSYENYDSVVFMPVAADSLKGMRVVGREVDLNYVLYRNRTVFI